MVCFGMPFVCSEQVDGTLYAESENALGQEVVVKMGNPSRFSNTRLFSLVRGAQKAVAVPAMPPPMITTSAVVGRSLTFGVAILPILRSPGSWRSLPLFCQPKISRALDCGPRPANSCRIKPRTKERGGNQGLARH
jgi:hypothetical protein